MPLPKNIYSLNEIGGRKNNEDAIWPLKGRCFPHNRLYLVCDGVGGNSHGEVASEMACRLIAEYFSNNLQSETQLNDAFINDARAYAMQSYQQYIADHPEAEKMSTTLTLAYLKSKSVFLAWCGDSKIFHLRNGEILFQSEDHSLVNELIKRGEINAEEAAVHPHRNVITRSLQVKQPYSAIQTHELLDVREGDHLLLCTDGVTERVTAQALRSILTEGEEELMLDRFQGYCRDRTRDNYSMYLLELADEKVVLADLAPAQEEKKKTGLWLSLVIITVLLIAAGLFYARYKQLL